jgi:hypothetical protein
MIDNHLETQSKFNFSKFVPSGPFRVGYLDFKSSLNDCSVFYPAADDKSGDLGIPFLTY